MDQLKFKKNVAIPRFPQKLPGTLWGMTTFFNPAKYKNKIENYRKFRESSQRQGLKLLAVELAFFNEPFELNKDDAEILIQVRSNSPMWQKERLLNIGLKHLPKDCDKVAWLDCDIIFKNDNWLKETSDLLEEYIALQLFSFMVYLPENASPENFNCDDLAFGYKESEFSHSHVFAAVFLSEIYLSKDYIIRGRPGGGLAIRRKVLEEIGFYDKVILGSNDTVFVDSLYGKKFPPLTGKYPKNFQRDLEGWVSKSFSSVRGSVFYINNIALHLWHGNADNRKFGSREDFFKKYDFNPKQDLKLNNDGCFEWASNKRELHKAVRNYFFGRKEGEAKFLDVAIPRFPQKLPGTLWGMTTFFNPAKYKNKIENYRKFRESSQRQGLKLLAVELAFFNEPFELNKDDAEILIQVRSNSPMWQKERLLNIGLKHLPKDCDKVAWLDCDIIFKNDNWLKETSDLLEEYIALQLFSFMVNIPENADSFNSDSAEKNDSSVFVITKEGAGALLYTDLFSPGHAFAMRRKVLEEIGFFDKAILGAGDDIMLRAFYGDNHNLDREKFSEKIKQEHNYWVKKVYSAVKGSAFYLDNTIFHLWHGDLRNRKYDNRYDLIKKYGFDPEFDLTQNSYRCFEWASDKKEFHREVKEYFFERKEEKPIETDPLLRIDSLKKRIINLKVEHIYGPEKIELVDKDIIVLCLVKNGEIYIRDFIDHYFLWGVKHIVFLDNGSSDKTVEIAKNYRNVTILETDFPFDKNNDMRMRDYLIERFAQNKWSLCVDIDEFFDYPFSNKIPLRALISYLNANSYTALSANMLDMFPAAIYKDREENFRRSNHCYYDISQIRKDDYYLEDGFASDSGIKVLTGGIRKVVFGLESFLTKHPLIFKDENTARSRTGHLLAKGRAADISAVLFHYKFTNGFFDYVDDAVNREHHYENSSDYKYYQKVINGQNFLNLKQNSSKQFQNTQELIGNGFMAVSEKFKNFANKWKPSMI